MKKIVLVLCAVSMVVATSSARADDAAILQQLRGQMQQIQQQIDALSKRLEAPSEKQEKAGEPATKQKEQTAALGKAVQVYGQMRLSGDNYSEDFGNGSKGFTVKSNASRFGIKGEVPTSLRDTFMIYQAEVLYGSADNTTQEIEWREGFAGLRGWWGQARLGRLDVPYKTTLTIIDPWNDSAPQSRGFGGRQGSSALHSSYFTNTVEYLTPVFAGFTGGVWLSTQLDGENSSIHNASPVSNYKGGDAKGVGIKFNRGPFYVGADLIDIRSDSVSGGMSNGSGWQVAARYKRGAWSAAALYEDVKHLGMGTNVYLNGTCMLGKTTLIATGGRNRDAVTYNKRNIDTWTLGAKYALTKDSELLVAWVNRNEGAYGTTPGKEFQILTMGINAKFGY